MSDRVDDIMGNRMEAEEVLNQLDDAIDQIKALTAYKKAFEAVRDDIKMDAPYYIQMRLLLERMDKNLADQLEAIK